MFAFASLLELKYLNKVTAREIEDSSLYSIWQYAQLIKVTVLLLCMKGKWMCRGTSSLLHFQSSPKECHMSSTVCPFDYSASYVLLTILKILKIKTIYNKNTPT